MWNGEHGYFHHVGVIQDDIFKLSWPNVEPTRDDHVVFAVEHVQITIRINFSDVAREYEPVGCHAFCGCFFIFPKAHHLSIAVNRYFTFFANGQDAR